MTLLDAIHRMADLPPHIVAAVPLALFATLCLLCMVPSITARIRGTR